MGDNKVTVSFSGWDAMSAALGDLLARVEGASEEIVTTGAVVLAEAIKARIAPISKTGRLAESVEVTHIDELGVGHYRASVAPTTPYARRLSIGFHGTDSLGRRYGELGHGFMSGGIRDATPALQELATSIWASAISM